jgi:hypothetical protein
MTPDLPVSEELLHALPKTDLHCHLDGSLRLKTMLELAEQQGVRLPADTEDGLAKAMKIGKRHGSLEEYLKGFEITLSVMQTEEALYRTAYELAIDAAAENCRLIEVRYAPVLHLSKGLKPTVVLTMEFPHFMRLMSANQFYTMYHEHYQYLSLIVVEKIFGTHGLTVFDVEELPTHGGSLRIFARHNHNESKPRTERAEELH